MAQPHRHRAFADGGGRAEDGAAADIAHGEDSGQTGLEQVRVPPRATFPDCGPLHVRPGEDEALRIQRQRARELRGRRVGPDEDEQRLDRQVAPLPSRRVFNLNGLDGVPTDKLPDLRLRQDLDV